MKNLRHFLSVRRRPSAALCNDAEGDVAVIGMCNEFSPDEQGWVLIRYGDYPHSGKEANAFDRSRDLVNAAVPTVKRVVQRLTREGAEEMVREFKSAWGRIKRAVLGRNIYLGHPDAPRYASLWKDKAPRGTIADMEATDAGLRLRPVLNDQGAAEVAAGFREFSPNWTVRGAELAPDGTLYVEPFHLTSMGLVRKGNMAGISLTNAADGAAPTRSTQENHTMPQWLIDLLIGAGLLKAGQSAEETARPALANHFEAHTALVAERDELKHQVATLSTEKTTLANAAETTATEVAGCKSEIETLKAELTAARSAHAATLVNAAIADGRVKAADKDATIASLANAADAAAFTSEAEKLAQLKPQLKTRSALGGIARHSHGKREAEQQITALVNAALPEHGGDYDRAFAAVASDPQHAALFGGLKRAEALAK